MGEYVVKRIDEMDAALFGSFKRARAELGVESFGMQVSSLPQWVPRPQSLPLPHSVLPGGTQLRATSPQVLPSGHS